MLFCRYVASHADILLARHVMSAWEASRYVASVKICEPNWTTFYWKMLLNCKLHSSVQYCKIPVISAGLTSYFVRVFYLASEKYFDKEALF